MEVLSMAKPIERTPTIEGEFVKEFLEEMERPNTPEEDMIKERIANRRRVDFL